MKIPATVITGFLGAGKTTLIRHLLRRADGVRLAILINEFGDRGIDRDMLLGCGDTTCRDDDIVELANGCICCTVADEFVPTMEKLLARDPLPDHIIIETSGLALPKPLVQAFNWPDIRTRLTVDGVIALIDAPALAAGRFADDPERVQAERMADQALTHPSPLVELFEDQLACADLVVLNKTDLVDADTLAELQQRLGRQVASGTKVIATSEGVLDARVALGIGSAAESTIEQRRCHHDEDEDDDHDHDQFASFVATFGAVGDPAEVEQRIRSIAAAHEVLRVKGFLHVAKKARRHVLQAVGSRIDGYYDRPWTDGEVRRSELVVIGKKGLDRDAVTAALIG